MNTNNMDGFNYETFVRIFFGVDEKYKDVAEMADSEIFNRAKPKNLEFFQVKATIGYCICNFYSKGMIFFNQDRAVILPKEIKTRYELPEEELTLEEIMTNHKNNLSDEIKEKIHNESIIFFKDLIFKYLETLDNAQEPEEIIQIIDDVRATRKIIFHNVLPELDKEFKESIYA